MIQKVASTKYEQKKKHIHSFKCQKLLIGERHISMLIFTSLWICKQNAKYVDMMVDGEIPCCW